MTAGTPVSLPGYATAGSVSVGSGATLAVCPTSAANPTGWTNTTISSLLGVSGLFGSGNNFGVDTTFGDFVLGSSISNASLNLLKLGAGTLTLGGSNTYAGNTTISAGTLSVATTGSLPGGLTPSNVSVAAGTSLVLGPTSTTYPGGWSNAQIGTLLASSLVANNPGANFGFDTTQNSITYAANIPNPSGGSLNLIKVGTGTLTLSGTNTYSGNTTVANGSLTLGVAAALPSTTTLTLGSTTGNTGGTLNLAPSILRPCTAWYLPAPVRGTLSPAPALGIGAGGITVGAGRQPEHRRRLELDRQPDVELAHRQSQHVRPEPCQPQFVVPGQPVRDLGRERHLDDQRRPNQ